MIEADIINLIGYETVLKFVFTSEGIFTFETIIPIGDNLDKYEIDFYTKNKGHQEFFRYDSFSSSLLKYQISEVRKNGVEIYFRAFEEE